MRFSVDVLGKTGACPGDAEPGHKEKRREENKNRKKKKEERKTRTEGEGGETKYAKTCYYSTINNKRRRPTTRNDANQSYSGLT